jgi:hypothetical protein
MNRKTKSIAVMTVLTFLLMVFANTPNTSAKAERFWHDVGKDAGSDTQTNMFDLPPENYPFTQVKMTSTFSWDNHWVYNEVFDAHENMHVNVKFVNKGTVQGEAWFWNDVSEEWVFVQSWSQTLKTISGTNELYTISGTQTSKQLSVSRETFEMKYVDPLTGEETTYEYMVIRHMLTKWVNGELQFENSWEMQKE